jgi:hypothetical protein
MRSVDLRLRRPARTHPVAALDLVRERKLLAGELAGDRLQPDELRAEPAGAPVIAFELVEQPDGFRDEHSRLAQGLRIDSLLDGRIAVVRVHEAVDVAAEPESELDVSLWNAHVRSAGVSCSVSSRLNR